jgi:hypothetical protein
MGILGEELKKRLGASWVAVSGTTTVAYTISLKLGPPKRSSATVDLSISPNCKFPVTATYTKGAKSGTSTFQTIPDLLSYLVFALKK